MAKRILVSACLLGENCKYNGGNNFNQALAEYIAKQKNLDADFEVNHCLSRKSIGWCFRHHVFRPRL